MSTHLTMPHEHYHSFLTYLYGFNIFSKMALEATEGHPPPLAPYL